jgi:hypothetical protein
VADTDSVADPAAGAGAACSVPSPAGAVEGFRAGGGRCMTAAAAITRMIRDMREPYPCCDHCHYPGCPQWDRVHAVRCWQCLRHLCATHGEPPEVRLIYVIAALRDYLITVEKDAEVERL